jgi:hypothetical protein
VRCRVLFQSPEGKGVNLFFRKVCLQALRSPIASSFSGSTSYCSYRLR